MDYNKIAQEIVSLYGLWETYENKVWMANEYRRRYEEKEENFELYKNYSNYNPQKIEELTFLSFDEEELKKIRSYFEGKIDELNDSIK